MCCKEGRRDSDSDLVFKQLREKICTGELRPGEQLPPDRMLAEAMNVSRYAVKKAMDALAYMGHVEHRERQGYFVSLPGATHSRNPFSYIMSQRSSSLDELMEVRMGLESHGVMLAVDMADDKDIAFLRQTLTDLATGEQDVAASRDSDIRFHTGIALATHNSVYIDLIRHFYGYMFDSISKLHDMLYEDERNREIIEKHHYKIFDAIADRDKKGAKRYMMHHITFLRSFLRDKEGPERDTRM